jgi:hypothetical protein
LLSSLGVFLAALSDWGVSVDRLAALQKNVDEAVEGLRAKGITVVGAVCHVSDVQQRRNLIETAVKVGIVEGCFSLSGLVWLSSDK